MNYRSIVIGGLFLLLVVSCKKSTAPSEVAKEQKYQVVSLDTVDVELQSVYPAVLKGQEDIDIKPRVEGFIDALYV